MNKKILSTSIGAILAGTMSVAAMADTTLYGNVHISYDVVDVDDAGNRDNLNSNTSSIGVKGSEDLGNGLKAIFQAEFQFDPTEGSGLTGRDQWVGLGSGWGKLRVGTISTSYKSHGAMIDPIYRTSAQNRTWGFQSALHRGKGEDGEGRATNTIRYDSPSFFGGLGFIGTFTRQTDNGKDNKTDNPFSVGAHYKFGDSGLVFADYITNDQDGDNSAWKVGGKWMIGNFGLYGQYEKDDGLIANRSLDSNVAGVLSTTNIAQVLGLSRAERAFLNDEVDEAIANGDVDSLDTYFLGASYSMGNWMFYGAYGHGDNIKVDGVRDFDLDTEYDSYELVAHYRFSKRTDMYGGWVLVDYNNDVKFRDPDTGRVDEGSLETNVFTLGVRHKF